MNTDLAKKWLNENHAYSCKAVLAFARYLDERDERVRCQRCQNFIEPHHWAIGQRGQFWHRKCHELTMTEDEKPRKEDKPVCLACQYNERNGNDDAKVHTCKPVCIACTTHGCATYNGKCLCPHTCQPKPEPIEELSGGVVYADARDEVSKKIAEQMARKIIELQNKLNEVIRRLNTITK